MLMYKLYELGAFDVAVVGVGVRSGQSGIAEVGDGVDEDAIRGDHVEANAGIGTAEVFGVILCRGGIGGVGVSLPWITQECVAVETVQSAHHSKFLPGGR